MPEAVGSEMRVTFKHKGCKQKQTQGFKYRKIIEKVK